VEEDTWDKLCLRRFDRFENTPPVGIGKAVDASATITLPTHTRSATPEHTSRTASIDPGTAGFGDGWDRSLTGEANDTGGNRSCWQAGYPATPHHTRTWVHRSGGSRVPRRGYTRFFFGVGPLSVHPNTARGGQRRNRLSVSAGKRNNPSAMRLTGSIKFSKYSTALCKYTYTGRNTWEEVYTWLEPANAVQADSTRTMCS
jgi:hypothetical protein